MTCPLDGMTMNDHSEDSTLDNQNAAYEYLLQTIDTVSLQGDAVKGLTCAQVP